MRCIYSFSFLNEKCKLYGKFLIGILGPMQAIPMPGMPGAIPGMGMMLPGNPVLQMMPRFRWSYPQRHVCIGPVAKLPLPSIIYPDYKNWLK